MGFFAKNMENYCLDDHVQRMYAQKINSEPRPIIGLTTNHRDTDAFVRDRYYKQIVEAGGVPILLPPTNDEAVLFSYIDLIDGFVITGGGDCDPRWQGEEASPLLGNVNEERDLPELLLARLAKNRQMPILGICRGMQMMATAYGGHVSQDISLDANWQREKGIVHTQKEAREQATHTIVIDKNSILYDIYARERLDVNSFHHQTADKAPASFRVTAWAEDGVIEAIESAENKPFLGVQWHPEWLPEDGKPIFTWFVGEAKLYKKVKELHSSIITLDSHCDTPSACLRGGDLTKRDDHLQVDLIKMAEGRLDVATMAAYVPQPTGSKTWKDIAPVPSDTPFDYANLMLDYAESLVKKATIPVSIVRKPSEVLLNKREGRKSIMFAVENALPIGDDLSRVEYFKKRGAVYITLCHNGDNQVCDSARDSLGTWNGLSPFGQKVVAQMNRQGIIIDLSHAGEKSFYDVVEASKSPVVCSHSNCKALCSHERNLTDDQLRRLAKKNGVCQLTIYEGFTHNNPLEADILSFVEHVVHAVEVMGIEHVGLGSDFDGGGGLRGLNDVSEVVNFTRQLLRRRFSDDDIRLIWGGNWLRLMAEIQGENIL